MVAILPATDLMVAVFTDPTGACVGPARKKGLDRALCAYARGQPVWAM